MRDWQALIKINPIRPLNFGNQWRKWKTCESTSANVEETRLMLYKFYILWNTAPICTLYCSNRCETFWQFHIHSGPRVRDIGLKQRMSTYIRKRCQCCYKRWNISFELLNTSVEVTNLGHKFSQMFDVRLHLSLFLQTKARPFQNGEAAWDYWKSWFHIPLLAIHFHLHFLSFLVHF